MISFDTKMYIRGSKCLKMRRLHIFLEWFDRMSPLTNLNKFSLKVICVSNRVKSLKDIYHNNSFSSLVDYKNVAVDDNGIFIIANNTADHIRLSNVSQYGRTVQSDFCENPGLIVRIAKSV